MTKHRQVQKQQLIREAEGYLDLLLVSGRLRVKGNVRDALARRAMAVLDQIGDFGVWKPHANYLRGQAYRLMERYGEAIGPLKAAAEVDRTNVHIWLALGWCHKRCGRIDLAIEALEEAVSYEPKQAIVHYNLACYWSLARNVRRSVACLARAFDLDSNYRDRVASEADFDPVREHPLFHSVTTVIV